MPNINGTGGDDDIDVTDDDGTLNGTPQGSPIDDIRARAGNDTITVTNSTIANNIRGNAGSDQITITDSTVTGMVNAGRDNDTVNIQGSDVGSIRLGRGDDELNFIDTTVSTDIRGGTGTDSLNLPVGTIVNDATFGTFTVTVGGSYSLSNGTFTLPSGNTVTYTTFENGTGFPCFVRGTQIQTTQGLRRVETLKVGDLIPTSTNNSQKIRWIGSRKLSPAEFLTNPKLLPVRIMAGALGNGLPKRDLLVSRQHRMLIRSKISERMFGKFEILLPAIKLVELPGIFVDTSLQDIEYFHLLFDQHEIIFAEAAPTESLLTGQESLKSLDADTRQEILAIFPEISKENYTPEPARYIPSDQRQKQLVARHLKNNKPILLAL
ncbi:MAG: Hint domain-containing protein [Paracoccaceae bacterium]